MSTYVLISYSASLILLFIGIVCLKIAYSNPNHSKKLQWLLRFVGVIPGFAGVIWGVYVQLIQKNPEGLVIMSAWLILEIGTVKLLNLMKKITNA